MGTGRADSRTLTNKSVFSANSPFGWLYVFCHFPRFCHGEPPFEWLGLIKREKFAFTIAA
jgi:hypothetical protein